MVKYSVENKNEQSVASIVAVEIGELKIILVECLEKCFKSGCALISDITSIPVFSYDMMTKIVKAEYRSATAGIRIIGPPLISPIGSYVKQIMQYWVLWLQNASNCPKYDVVSIFRA